MTNNNKKIGSSVWIKRIRKANKSRNDLIYKLSKWTIVLIGIFLTITIILQINWFLQDELPQPVLTWIVAQPYVGVFFTPFIFVSSYFALVFMNITKPVTIKQIIIDVGTIYENDLMHKKRHDEIVDHLQVAYKEQLDIEKTQREEQQKRIQQNLILQEMSNGTTITANSTNSTTR